MRFAIGSVLSALFILALFANALNDSATPWSAQHQRWTKDDERLLAAHLPGGRFISTYTYVRCEKDGQMVAYHADGLTTRIGSTCWSWRRWIGQELAQ